MPLHMVLKDVYPFKRGDYVEEFDGMMQKVRTAQIDGRLQLGGYVGVCVPAKDVRKWTVRVQKGGLDDEIRKNY